MPGPQRSPRVTFLLDENLPRGLRRLLAPRNVVTVQQAGFAGLENGRLLAAIAGVFDVLITADKNLRYQQNPSGRQLSIIELPTNRWPLLRTLEARIVQAADTCQASGYQIVAPE